MTDGFDPGRAREVLGAAARETLADMTFLDALPAEGTEEEAAAAERVRAAIDVLKPASCRLELQAPEAFRQKVYEILFPPEEGKETQDDAFLEILNVIAGKFLTGYFGPAAEIRMELPRFLFPDEGTEGNILCSLDLDAEGCRLSMALSSIRYRY